MHIIKWPSGQVAYPQDVRALNSEFKRTLNQIDSKVVVQPFFIFFVKNYTSYNEEESSSNEFWESVPAPEMVSYRY